MEAAGVFPDAFFVVEVEGSGEDLGNFPDLVQGDEGFLFHFVIILYLKFTSL